MMNRSLTRCCATVSRSAGWGGTGWRVGGRGALVLLAVGATPAIAQEVGDTLTIVVIPTPEAVAPETTFVPSPPIVELDTVYACPADFTRTDDGDSWACNAPVPPDTLPPIVVDSTPPLAVSGLALSIDGTDLVVEWNDRPSPDRGGVLTTGYYVSHGFQEPGHEPDSTVNVLGSPHRIALTGFGERWVCVTPHNDFSGESSCDRVAYDPPPVPTSLYLLSVAPEPYAISGQLEVVEGDYSIHLDRIDGSWSGIGDVTVPGVGPVRFCLGGVCNDEYRLPYELGGGVIPLTIGTYEVSWEVFGDEPDSGSSTVVVTTSVGGNPIEIGGTPNDSSNYFMGVGCDWGDQRCTDAGDIVDVALVVGQTGRLIGLIEFPPDDRIFVSFQEEIFQVAQNDRGWVCLLLDGDRYSFPTIVWEWTSTDEAVAVVDNGPMLTLPVNCP